MFFASYLFLDANNILDFVLKTDRMFFLIGRDNSPLNKHLKQIKLFRLQDILHDAAGCLEEKKTGPGQTYVLPCPIKSCHLG